PTPGCMAAGWPACHRTGGRVGSMRPSDLALLRIPSAPTLTPDGRLVAVAVGRIDLEANEYRAELWIIPTHPSAPPPPLPPAPPRPPPPLPGGRAGVPPRFPPRGPGAALLAGGGERQAAAARDGPGRRRAPPGVR